jgi:hypothetical protein
MDYLITGFANSLAYFKTGAPKAATFASTKPVRHIYSGERIRSEPTHA